jgi:O-antigen/teichoic acid export membrane protein
MLAMRVGGGGAGRGLSLVDQLLVGRMLGAPEHTMYGATNRGSDISSLGMILPSS